MGDNILRLNDDEKAEIIAKLQVYIDQYINQKNMIERIIDEETGDKSILIGFTLERKTMVIKEEDYRTIYMAVHSGDADLKELACKVITLCTYHYMMNTYLKDVIKSAQKDLTPEDKEDVIQEFYGVHLSRIIDRFDPDKGSLMNFLCYNARTVIRNWNAERIGASSKQEVTNNNRIQRIMDDIEKETGNTNPSASEIRERDIKAGRKQPLSIKAIQRYLNTRGKHDISTELIPVLHIDKDEENLNPLSRFMSDYNQRNVSLALSRLSDKHRKVIIKVLEDLDTSSPREENRQLISYVRDFVLEDSTLTDEYVIRFMEQAYTEFKKTLRSISEPHARKKGKRDSIFSRWSDDAIMEREMQDIQDSMEEDLLYET